MATTLYINSSEAGDGGTGLHIFDLDTETGALTLRESVSEIAQAAYFNLHPTRKYLYSGSYVNGAAVHSFAIGDDGGLTWLNSQSVRDNAPCYVSVDKTGRYLLAASYASDAGQGSAAVFPIGEDGKLAPMSDYRQYPGSSTHPQRQGESHPHMITQEPIGSKVVIPDLGTDKIMLHTLNLDMGRFEDTDHLDLAPGAGPRHAAFKSSYLYVIDELDDTVTAYAFAKETGKYTLLQTIPTLPDNAADTMPLYPVDEFGGVLAPGSEPDHMAPVNYPADLHVHPNGRFLYGSNRGHNSIVIYAIGEDGHLTVVDHQGTLGNWPRAFQFDPSGQLLICANQWSNDVVTFWVDADSGKLTPTGHKVSVYQPNCIQCLG
ncbi:MAG: lactonase family protein [Anaerolineae bacterium]|nr:lactonase family protein [Anaerolineae bacterium]